MPLKNSNIPLKMWSRLASVVEPLAPAVCCPLIELLARGVSCIYCERGATAILNVSSLPSPFSYSRPPKKTSYTLSCSIQALIVSGVDSLAQCVHEHKIARSFTLAVSHEFPDCG